MVEGRPLVQHRPDGTMAPLIQMGSDGIAIGADGSRLYYCPLASRRLYSVSTEALRDETLTPAEVAATIRDDGASAIVSYEVVAQISHDQMLDLLKEAR